MKMELRELSEFIIQQKETIQLKDREEYVRVTVKLHRKGIVLRDRVQGMQIKTKTQQVCKKDQFLVAEIDAKVGGYGIVPESLEGAIVSNHYYLFDVDDEKLNVDYLRFILDTEMFFSQITPQGSTNYASVRPSDVMKIKIPYCDLEDQISIARRLKNIERKNKVVFSNSNQNEKLTARLRQAILREAMQGKLVLQDSNDESASVLLGRIKQEKQRLYKESKIRKPKRPLRINPEEIPYELPEGWEWTKLGNASIYQQRGKPPKYSKSDEFPVLNQKCVRWYSVQYADIRYLKKTSLDKYQKYRFLQDKDLLWNSTGTGTVGRIGIYERDSSPFERLVVDSHVTIVRFSNHLMDPYFAMYWLSTNFVQNNLGLTGSTKQQELSLRSVRNVPLPVPPFSEQKRIVEKIDKMMEICDQLEERITENQNYSEELMNAVLREAFETAS